MAAQSHMMRVHLWMLLVSTWPALGLLSPLHATPVRLALVALVWSLGIRRIVWPFYFGPISHLPLASGHYFAVGHGFAVLQTPPGRSCYSWAQTPNAGLVRLGSLFYNGGRLMVCSPKNVGEVLNTHAYDYVKPVPPRRFLTRILGTGLLLSEGQEHKAQRKILSPAFQGHNIKQLASTFWAKSLELTDVLASEIGGKNETPSKQGVIEMGNFASRATLDIIGIAGFGRDFRSLENDDDELANLFSILTDPSDPRIRRTLVSYIFLPKWLADNLPTNANRLVTASSKRLRRVCLDMVEQKKRRQERGDAKDQRDILSTLLRSDALTETELVDQLLTFLAAGHETTASALTWTSYLLAIHPDVQLRLREEVCRTLPPKPTPEQVTADMLDSMPYLAAVCSESLRVYATVPITSRVAIKETMIGDTRIPAGTIVVLAPSAINKLPALWGDDASEFNPDRWMALGQASLGGSQSTFSQITFLHGPRSCIGQSFARLELKALVAAIVIRFSLEMADPNAVVQPAGVITIKPRDGLYLRLKELDQV